MNILYVEPFLGGSHQRWIDVYAKNSVHSVEIIGLPDNLWKWRMTGGTVELANRFNELSLKPDIILVSDMLDLATFKGLVKFDGPIILYFHENQITYPVSPNDKDVLHKRDNYYGFINFTSAMVADQIWFNSSYHQQIFLNALVPFLDQFPSNNLKDEIPALWSKSEVVYSGLDLSLMDKIYNENIEKDKPIILWNHRWEHDKNPTLFFDSLLQLQEDNIAFKLVALGEHKGRNRKNWDKYKLLLEDNILHWGFVNSHTEYVNLLKRSNILAVTSNHDYFGISVVEAIYTGCYPILPKDLAYPEHINSDLQSEILYKKGDFYTHLKSVILNRKYNQDLTQLKDHVSRYDWSIMAPHYDQLFASINEKY